MPRKIRHLKADLRKAGLVEQPHRGKGSHSFWVHSEHTGVSITVAGHNGDAAKGYQEKQVREAIARAISRQEAKGACHGEPAHLR
ncbi:MAG: type II toxin-antitoxin system HicA family toxin [Candidatus Binatia bacterium]